MDGPKKKSVQSQEELDISMRILMQNRSHLPINLQISNPDMKKKIEKDLNKEASITLFKQFEHGYQSLIEEITKNAVNGVYSRDTHIEPIPVEDFQIPSDTLQAIKKVITDKTNSEHTIDDLCHFDSDVQLLFYDIGVHFYEKALYEKSIDAFVFLTTIYPNVQPFWAGLALAHEKNLNLNKAIESFEAAIKSNPSEFSPFYGLLRCCEVVKDYSKVEELLEVVKDEEATKEEAAEVSRYIKSKK